MFKFLEDLKSEYGSVAVALVVAPWILSYVNALVILFALYRYAQYVLFLKWPTTHTTPGYSSLGSSSTGSSLVTVSLAVMTSSTAT